MRREKPELLIPASSLEVLKTAVIFGADAVYIGGEAFGLRAKAKNFTSEEMAEGIAFAHAHGVKVYVTANILAHNDDLSGAAEYFEELKNMKPDQPDALIISDPGMFTIAKQVWPQVEIHISTQANNTNYQTYLFWWQLGAKRVVSARELSLAEIAEIRAHIPEDMEIESFIHGAMCISYSGRCLLSNYFTGRDANQGACTHPCRWKYAVVEEKRPGEYLPVYENERGTYIFNSKDLCMIEYVPEIVAAGIDSLKIEGRMKTALYVATVARTYRKAIDDLFTSEETYRANMDWYKAEISKCTYRQFTTGFYFGKPDENTQIYDSNTYVNEYIYLGIVDEVAERRAVIGADVTDAEAQNADVASVQKVGKTLVRIEQRNKFCVGDSIEIMKPDGNNVSVQVLGMYNADMEPVESCPHSKQEIWLELSELPKQYDLLRVKA
ncbi:MAG: U32 family peptidase C-terminal domain-containing protein [Lachnospiraceae bacterium]|nr:U32 family peptidase C-terminal domain-containing protein [Lachnospiraceae bacterium]